MSLMRFMPLEFRRRRLLQKTPAGPLHDYLSVPFADSHLNYRDVHYVAMDLETTGLDHRRDHILSVGMVELKGNRIDLSTATHRIVTTEQELSEETVVIHQLTDDVIARGEPIKQILTDVLHNLAGKVLLAHHARIEFGFLRSACQRVFGGDFLIPIVDTLVLARQQMLNRNQIHTSSSLRLASLRNQYHLPRYKAHNALSDALSAAELFLAQMAERGGKQHDIRLNRILHRI